MTRYDLLKAVQVIREGMGVSFWTCRWEISANRVSLLSNLHEYWYGLNIDMGECISVKKDRSKVIIEYPHGPKIMFNYLEVILLRIVSL